jgi:hypothetical protein
MHLRKNIGSLLQRKFANYKIFADSVVVSCTFLSSDDNCVYISRFILICMYD